METYSTNSLKYFCLYKQLWLIMVKVLVCHTPVTRVPLCKNHSSLDLPDAHTVMRPSITEVKAFGVPYVSLKSSQKPPCSLPLQQPGK